MLWSGLTFDILWAAASLAGRKDGIRPAKGCDTVNQRFDTVAGPPQRELMPSSQRDMPISKPNRFR